MKPEEKARQTIDNLLEAAGWGVQNLDELNLGQGLGVAIREFPLKNGTADYLLFIDRRAVGDVAKGNPPQFDVLIKLR
jgi:type I restriction enzyme R subunit